MRDLMIKMWDPSGPGSLNPSALFTEVGGRSARFRGRNQQDSHELLRVLLDALHDEERRRITASNMHLNGSSVSSNHKEQHVRQVTVVELLVEGQLESSIACAECSSISRVQEPFFDLSLPMIYGDNDTTSSTVVADVVSGRKSMSKLKQGEDQKKGLRRQKLQMLLTQNQAVRAT
mmetsp:Transcript_4199/g.7375  ORF Transcript_4199/g.7375 Transcript_4199/m.7375 type:complete len:176 (-) Transcript_4199:1249-1776(-)